VKRRLFNVMAGVSMMLCLATVALWVRSYWRSDAMTFLATPSSSFFLGDWRGHLDLTRQYIVPAVPSGWVATTSNYGHIDTARQDGHLSGGVSFDPHLALPNAFYLGHTVPLGTSVISSVQLFNQIEVWAVPFWLIVLAFATLPAIFALRALRASRRSIRGLCSTCGYDLRATPERCPECGTVPPRKEIVSS
jgi:hypothetical protein